MGIGERPGNMLKEANAGKTFVATSIASATTPYLGTLSLQLFGRLALTAWSAMQSEKR